MERSIGHLTAAFAALAFLSACERSRDDGHGVADMAPATAATPDSPRAGFVARCLEAATQADREAARTDCDARWAEVEAARPLARALLALFHGGDAPGNDANALSTRMTLVDWDAPRAEDAVRSGMLANLAVDILASPRGRIRVRSSGEALDVVEALRAEEANVTPIACHSGAEPASVYRVERRDHTPFGITLAQASGARGFTRLTLDADGTIPIMARLRADQPDLNWTADCQVRPRTNPTGLGRSPSPNSASNG